MPLLASGGDSTGSGGHIRATLGLTPYQKRIEGELTSEQRLAYYDTIRYREYATRFEQEAAKQNVRLLAPEHSTGIWLGELEPSDLIEVEGRPEDIASLARTMATLYQQDAVMVITPDRKAEGALYRFTGIHDVEYAIDLLREVGIEGGTFTDNNLEIADSDGSLAARIKVLAKNLGRKPQKVNAHIAFIKGE